MKALKNERANYNNSGQETAWVAWQEYRGKGICKPQPRIWVFDNGNGKEWKIIIITAICI